MLTILCGLPGSGKTTYAHKLASETGAILRCYDDLPGAFSPSKQQAVHAQMWAAIAEELRQGYDVVCDDLHHTKEKRRMILDAVRGIECKKVLVLMDTPLDECLKRNAGRKRRLPDVVLHSCAARFEEPTMDEGFDEIIVVND